MPSRALSGACGSNMALHFAANEGYADALCLLLAAGADARLKAALEYAAVFRPQ